jgi:hypothetical protein
LGTGPRAEFCDDFGGWVRDPGHGSGGTEIRLHVKTSGRFAPTVTERTPEATAPWAKNLTKQPPDLTRIRQRAGGAFDAKVVFDWIVGLNMPASHGTREMPIWGDWLLDEAVGDSTSLEAADTAEKEVTERIMTLVRYLKSLQQ